MISQVLQPLKAKAHTLLFGVKLAATLDPQDATLLFTNNQASVVLLDFHTHLGRSWSLRPIIAEVQDINQSRSYSLIKIHRDIVM